jgi:AraC family transcriptional regulator
VGWSADHLRRMFRSVLGSAPAQVQTAARLRRARELLRYGALPIGEIARRCGFEDASHFARVFKRELGCTPREWAVLVRVEQNDGNGR